MVTTIEHNKVYGHFGLLRLENNGMLFQNLCSENFPIDKESQNFAF